MAEDIQPDLRKQEIELAPWRLMTRFVLRSPGFPFSWLEQLYFSDSVTVTQRLVSLTTQKQRMQDAFAGEIFPVLCDEETAAQQEKSVFRFWYRLAKRIRRGQTVGSDIIEQVEGYGRSQLANWLQNWQDVCTNQHEARKLGESTFWQELEQKRHLLRQFVQDPRFQEALWLSNPAIYEVGWRSFERRWRAKSRPAKIKHLERRFYTYLQRFCAKNDTTSFFGPLNYGRFDDHNTSVRYRWSGAPIRRRHVFFAYWASESIADLIAADEAIRPYLTPRPNPLKPGVPQDRVTATLHQHINGQLTIAELATLVQQSPAEVLATVEQLATEKWVHLDLPIPPSILDPLIYLTQQIEGLPATCSSRASWLSILSDLQQACDHYATADLPQRQVILKNLEEQYTDLTGGEGRRGQGKIFQDRTLLYEECLGGLEEFGFSQSQQQHIMQALTPTVALSATYAHLVRMDLQDIGRALFKQLSPDQKPIPFIRFISAWRRQYPVLPPLPKASRFEQQFADLVTQHQTGPLCSLTTADVLPLCQLPAESITLSPDVLLAAPSLDAIEQGNYQVVMGEIHHGVQPVGWMLVFAEDAAGWGEEIRQHLPQPTQTNMPANLLFGRRMKTAPPEFDGPSVQISAASTHPQPVDLSELFVETNPGGTLQLCTPHGDKSLTFYAPSYGVPESMYAPFACFSYLLAQAVSVNLGRHTPRIEIEGTVYQRETWRLATDELPALNETGTSYQLIPSYLEFQTKWGLPRHIFVKTEQEPKPIYIDLHSYFALELLVHVASQTDTITLVEMVPAPSQLWLEKDNHRYTCELRTVMSTN